MEPSDHGLCHDFGEGVHMKEVFSDNDWAVARKGTRKSGSSWMFDLFCKPWPEGDQPSAEAELPAAVSATCDGTLVQLCLQFLLGYDLKMFPYVDNGAARQVLQRSGVGRMSTKVLRAQAKVRDNLFRHST